jgi:hypothetical protein
MRRVAVTSGSSPGWATTQSAKASAAPTSAWAMVDTSSGCACRPADALTRARLLVTISTIRARNWPITSANGSCARACR